MSDQEDPLILAIDNGTQSVRALLFDARGELVGRHKIEIEPWYSEAPGCAEQDSELYWQEIGRACRALWDDYDPKRVAAVSVTTQRGTQICLDADGQPLRPAIVWTDRRRVDEKRLPKMPPLWRVLIGLSGRRNALKQLRENAECNWLAVHEPETWEKTAAFVGVSGFLNHRLTGRLADSVGSQVGYLPFDYRARRWASPKSWRWPALSIRRDQLPELVNPGDRLGELTDSAAEHLGLSAGLPVIAAGADKACDLVGAGISDRNTACISFGTRSTISVHSARYFEAKPPMPAFPAARHGYFMVEAAVPRGFWMVSWFKEQFGLEERQRAEASGVSAESLLDELVDEVPAGSLGLMLQPYWGHDIDPGPEAKGAIIGFGDVHTRAHLYRALLEGVAYELRSGAERIERRSSRRLQALRACGGGARSDTVMQITADIFNCPVERPHTVETSGLGAAILAAYALGWYPSVRVATKEMTRVGHRIEPNPDNRAVYEKLYRRVYRRLYKRLAPLYHDIREITGYPD
ncbi:FGGY-family carbohydrate kinase [Wenzhouxiangella sp. EGI_FJ10305]|uniref:FGGY-family carbohydrate kinase n=1 Tax=Wenzhouxiangella sp. EGI_FJ10305 TaxID=3243768 RepID=UPI0035E1E1E3